MQREIFEPRLQHRMDRAEPQEKETMRQPARRPSRALRLSPRANHHRTSARAQKSSHEKSQGAKAGIAAAWKS